MRLESLADSLRFLLHAGEQLPTLESRCHGRCSPRAVGDERLTEAKLLLKSVDAGAPAFDGQPAPAS